MGDPTSFPRGTVQGGSECVDMWETRCSELSQSSNNGTCHHADSCLDEILFESQDDDMSALSACCAFGGGFRTGKSLLIEEASAIRYCDIVLHFLMHTRREMGVCDFGSVRQHKF